MQNSQQEEHKNGMDRYLPIMIILPTIFGGIWQFYELSKMSISYVRFFSVTQLVADGIIVIAVFLPWIIGYILYIFLIEINLMISIN